MKRAQRATADAYAIAARILFCRTMGQGTAVEDILRKQLADDLELAIANHAQLSMALRETPTSALNPAEHERVRGHRASVQILAAQIDEITQMKRYLDKTQ